jgi:AhpC/TSA family
MINNKAITVLLTLFFLGCGIKKEGTLYKVKIHLQHAAGAKIYLEKVSDLAAENIKLDSADILTNNETVNLEFTAKEESLYYIRVKGDNGFSFGFVNDVAALEIKADVLFKKNLQFLNSPANQSYLGFIKKKEMEGAFIKATLDSLLFKLNTSKHDFQKAQINRGIDSVQRAMYKNWLNYANEEKSPANFLRIFPSLEFYNDTALLFNTVSAAKKRFPLHSQIETLYNKTNEYIDIFRKEYRVNDTLPDFSLPDRNGKVVSIKDFRSKYLLVDFWHSLNPDNNQHDLVLRKLYESTQRENFEILSIAIEQGGEFWYKSPKVKNAPWPQLIDSLGWAGNSVRITKIDSIPFNFLLNPDGVILATAINRDSLLNVIDKRIAK